MRLQLLLAVAALGGVALVHPAVASPAGDRLLRDVQAGVGEQSELDPIFGPGPADITAEPSIAANPESPANAVVAFKVGIGESMGVATTFDGGRSWTSGLLPCTDRPNASADDCGGAGAYGTTDPVVAFGPKSVVHVSYLDGSDNLNVSTSFDGGDTWGHPMVAVGPSSGAAHHDKDWLAVDIGTTAGHHPGRSYLVWAQEPQGSPQVTYSDDGSHWATPTDFPIGHGSDFQALVLADGSLGVFYDTGDTAATGIPNEGVPSAPEQYMFVRATVPTGGGQVIVGTPMTIAPAVHRNEADQLTVFDASTAAVDPGTGAIYAAWSDSSTTPYNSIAFASAQLRDNAVTWSSPQVVAHDDAGDLFHPALSVGKDGRVHLAWRDRRVAGGALTNEIEAYAAESPPGGATFSAPVQLTGALTDVTYSQRPDLPESNGWFVGDYDEAATSGPLTYVARAEAYAVSPEGEFCPQAADTVPEGCMSAPHQRIWVAVLGRR